MSKQYSYTIRECDGYTELTFEEGVEQEFEVDAVNAQLLRDFGLPDFSDIDWRDENTCWIWDIDVE